MGKRKRKGIKRPAKFHRPVLHTSFAPKGEKRGPRLVLYFFFMLLMALLIKYVVLLKSSDFSTLRAKPTQP